MERIGDLLKVTPGGAKIFFKVRTLTLTTIQKLRNRKAPNFSPSLCNLPSFSQNITA